MCTSRRDGAMHGRCGTAFLCHNDLHFSSNLIGVYCHVGHDQDIIGYFRIFHSQWHLTPLRKFAIYAIAISTVYRPYSGKVWHVYSFQVFGGKSLANE